MKIRFGLCGFSLYIRTYFYFEWAIYAQDLYHAYYWHGIRLAFRLPWQKLVEGAMFPFWFELKGDSLHINEAGV